MAGIFKQKTEEERAAEAARKAEAAREAQAARDAKVRRKAEEEFWASTPGQAVLAFNAGDEFFSFEEPYSYASYSWIGGPSSLGATMPRGKASTDVLGRVEAAGWRLEHANWVYVQTGTSSRDKFGASGQFVEVSGKVIGIYLFRRDDSCPNRVTGRPTQ